MNNERYNALMRDEGELTDEELLQGWHFCADWDGLLIAPETISKMSEWGDDPNKCRCGMRLVELHDDGTLHQYMVKTEGGASFRCNCGCNVFHKYKGDDDIFICNSCNEEFKGTL